MPRSNNADTGTMEAANYAHPGTTAQGGGSSSRGSAAGGNTTAAGSSAAMMGMPAGFEGDMRGRFSMGHVGGMPQMGGMEMGGGGFHQQYQYPGRGGGHDGMMGGGAGAPMMMQGPHGGGGYDLSPNMPRMTAGNMYALQQQQAQQHSQGASPSFRDTSGMAEMGPNSEGRANREGGPSSSGPGGTNSTGNPQADREEELLLNLLIARRQRTRMGDGPPQGPGGAGGRQDPYLADELLRLRQGRAMSAGHPMQGQVGPPGRGGGGTLPPMPGMPPIYMDHPVSGFAGEGIDQRIDRSPSHLMDARSQDMMMMRDLSGRGIKRGPYDMGGPAMMGHPYAPGMPVKYHMQMAGMDMAGGGGGVPQGKKKRSHKKKPADMPRRPLSAYNLFFSEERERILKEIDGKSEEGKEGKEEDGKKEGDKEQDEGKEEGKKEEGSGTVGDEEESSSKPQALLRPLIPSEKKRRPHRKTHGKISFQQLARMVGERWKKLPEDQRKYYKELAKEDMKRQKQAMEEYYAKQQALKDGRKPVEIGAAMEAASGMYTKPPQQPSTAPAVAEGIPETSV